jgi:hypothetical protein
MITWMLTMLLFAPAAPASVPTTAPASIVVEREISPRQIALPGDGAIELPMHEENGLPVVTLFYDGRARRFLLDTGAPLVTFRREVDAPRDHVAAPARQEPMRDGAGRSHDEPTQMIRVRNWSIGPSANSRESVDFADFEAACFDLPVFKRFNNIAGLIGRELFADCAITLDYRRGRLIIHRSSVAARDAIPMRVSSDGWTIDVDLAGRVKQLQIDTCARVGVWISEAETKDLPLSRNRTATRVNTALADMIAHDVQLLGDLRIGRYQIRRPIITVHGPETDHDLIGAEVLRRFTVTFDPPNKRMLLH